MTTANHGTSMAKRNPEIMQAVLDAVRKGVSVKETGAALGLGRTHGTVLDAFVVVREAPGLVQRVLDGELSIYKAHQIATRGEMHKCPVCDGHGYVFRKPKLRVG